MAEKNFMTAGTEIDGVVEKKNQCLLKISNIIAEVTVARAKNRKISSSFVNDINNLIKQLPEEDKVVILLNALAATAKQIDGRGDYSDDEDDRPKRSSGRDIFSSRKF